MPGLTFNFRHSTQEEILIFSEEFSNTCRLDPEVEFTTAILRDENYATFATKKTSFEPFDGKDEERRVLFFLILEHPLKNVASVYNLFCAFAKEMTYIEPLKENLGKAKLVCWNLQNKENHMYFEEVICSKGGERSINTPKIYRDGMLVKYEFETSAWKEKVNCVDRYYYEQKLASVEETPYTPEQYSDYRYAMLINLCLFINEMYYENFEHRRRDRATKKMIPLSKQVLARIEACCDDIMDWCLEYSCGKPILTPFLQEQFSLLKESEGEIYDKIWKMEDLNEPYFAETKAKLERVFRMLRGLKLPKGEE